MTDDHPPLRRSASFPPEVLAEIHRAADQGVYEIRGFGAKRSLPTFDDLVFLGASVSRYPLEGYRELRNYVSNSLPMMTMPTHTLEISQNTSRVFQQLS